jgi:hypothetical protein
MATKKRDLGNRVGGWAFLIGVILALILGVYGLSESLIIVLAIAGIIVGLFNIADKEATPFLFSGLVLVIVSVFGREILLAVPSVYNILTAFLILFIPATIIVALRNAFLLSKN